MPPIIQVKNIVKRYASGTEALSDVSLDIRQGEILALLGPNGAGKTTLISTICGLVQPSSGSVTVGGYDIQADYRLARSLIGLVPQELALDAFDPVQLTVGFTRGLYGLPPDPAHVETVLKSLSLWDKRDSACDQLSGGMKRRVMIAKALSHAPKVLFLDEPTAGVDVELRRDMWANVRRLREMGTTIILTTHYIEEAEEMADRIGIIAKGRLLTLQPKAELMHSFGKKSLTLDLQQPVGDLPAALAEYGLQRSSDGMQLTYDYDTRAARTGITRLIADLAAAGISVRDLESRTSSLEEVFLSLVNQEKAA